MKSDKENHKQVSLDDLFTLKRAERPSDEFWEDFQRNLHVRQRAEAIEPKRWWFTLPRVFAGLSRYQMPIGATAVLAVTFLSFRDYSEPGFEVAYTEPVVEAVAVESTVVTPEPEVVAEVATVEPVVEPEILINTPAAQIVAEVVSKPVSQHVDLAPMVVWAGPAISAADMVPATPTPSELSIAANLARVQAESFQVGRLLGEPQVNLAAAVTRSETLGQVTVPQPSRERLFVYQAPTEDFDMQAQRPTGRDTHSLIARRISQDELYDSVSRVTADGDRLTLKF